MSPEKRVIDGIEIEELRALGRSLHYYHLRKGNKHLEVRVDLEGRSAFTFMSEIPEAPKETGTTTILSRKALEIISGLAKEYGVSIHCRIETSDEKMKAWLRDPNKGMAILGGAEIKNTPTGIEAVLEINP